MSASLTDRAERETDGLERIRLNGRAKIWHQRELLLSRLIGWREYGAAVHRIKQDTIRRAASASSTRDGSRPTGLPSRPDRPAPSPASRPSDPNQIERSRHAGGQTGLSLPDLLAGSVPDGRLIALAMLTGAIAVILVLGVVHG